MVANEAPVAMLEEETACGPAVAFELLEPRVLLSAAQFAFAGPVTPGPVGPPTPAPVTADVRELVRDNNAFAFDLYQALRDTKGSLFFSPFSISAALSMTYAGAAGETARQMAEVLHFTLPSLLHDAAFGALMARLTTPQAAAPAGGSIYGNPGDPFTLKIANSLWGQPNFDFLDSFLKTLADEYDSPMRLTDFIANPEAARVRINQWVSDQTNGNIKDLIPDGAITDMTRLVLANAIYFKGSWNSAFHTAPGHQFQLPDGTIAASMMTRTDDFNYARGTGYQAIDLPYVGGASMTILLPDAGQFDSFEASLSAGKVESIISGLRTADVHITMPEFECRTKVNLEDTLSAMGMPDAFGDADFSLMSPNSMAISEVVHQAWIKVDKSGTEAAAATAVIMFGNSAYQVTPPPPVEMMVDRPFIYMIRDSATGSILFVGRVNDGSVLTSGGGSSGQDPTDPTNPIDPTPGGLIPVGPIPIGPPPNFFVHFILPPVAPPAVVGPHSPQFVAPTTVDTHRLLADALQSARPALNLGLSAAGPGHIGVLPSLLPALAPRIDLADAPTTQQPLQADWMVSALKTLGASRLAPSLALPL